MRRLIGFCLALGLLSTLYGCETVKGLGRDITNAGEAIEDATR
jgi:predicted small secreted protein